MGTEESDKILLESSFVKTSSAKSNEIRVKLTFHGMSWDEPDKGVQTVRIRDVVGCHVKRTESENEAVVRMCIYSYPIEGKLTERRRQRQAHSFGVTSCDTAEDNFGLAEKWRRAILWASRGHTFEIEQNSGHYKIPELPPPKRRILCLVNPKSGPGHSLDIFLTRVEPIFEEADIAHHLMVTDRINHAREFVRDMDALSWDAVVVISGDGLLHEVYNGLMDREDSDTTVKIPIGIIPGGSGNGLARSVCHATDEPYLSDPILACIFVCVKGEAKPLDLFEIRIPDRKPIYSFLSFGWGLMSDIDIESEQLRSIGEIRFTLWAFWRILNLRTYAGRVWYKLADSPANEDSLNGNFGARNDEDKVFELKSDETKTGIDACTDELPKPTLYETEEDILNGNSEWRLEEGRFVQIYSSLVSHLGTKLFFAPRARLDDGVCWLMMIKGEASRSQMLFYFHYQEQGKHVELPWVKSIPVKAFRLESFDDCFVTVDGEQVNTRRMEAEVLPGKARILSL